MSVPDPNSSSDIISRDKSIYGDEVRGNKITTRSPHEELRDYLAAAVPSYALAQMQRVVNAQLQQSITEPYKFLDSFELEDANFFFGRGAAIQSLHRAVTTNRLTVLHAKSGAGKTSLLNAGLAPKLITTGRLPIYARSFHNPVQAVKRAVAPGSAGPWPDLLYKLSLSEFLGLVCQHLPARVKEIVLILDQFEEFFIFWPLRAQRQPFISDFAQCYRDSELPVRFILSLRKDYYSDLAEFESYIPKIFRSQLRLDPMERAQAAEAITAPVTRLGSAVTYAPDLLNAILDDLGGSGMELPHMQIICTKLFEDAVDAKTISLPVYEALGRAPGILGDYLNGTLARFPGRGGVIAKSILTELVSSEATKRTLPLATLRSRVVATPSDLDDTLTRLVNTRLVRRDEVEGEIVFEMAHEYLIAEIKQWIDVSDLAFKQVEELLSREVLNWRIHGTLIPRDRLEMIFAQRARLGRIDDETGECLLRSALQSGIAVEEWMHIVTGCTIQPLLVVLTDSTLNAASEEAFLAAVEILNKLGDGRAVEPLIAALNDESKLMRSGTATALGKLGSAAVEPLIAALQDENQWMRCGATEALGKLGDARAVEPLIIALRDVSPDVRSTATVALGKLGDARAVEPLIVVLQHASVEVRCGAAEALGQLGDTRAVEPLIAALTHKSADVGRSAATALGKLGDARAVEPLIGVLINENVSKDARMAAAAALGQLGDARAVEPLITTLNTTLHGASGGLRDGATEALVQLGDASVKPLIAALDDKRAYPEKVRMAAAIALGKLGDARAVVPLINALKSKDKDVCRTAAAALGKLGDARAVEPLIGALKDDDKDVRRAAAVALGKLGDARAVGPLGAVFKDPNPGLRSGVSEALKAIGTPEAFEILK